MNETIPQMEEYPEFFKSQIARYRQILKYVEIVKDNLRGLFDGTKALEEIVGKRPFQAPDIVVTEDDLPF